MFAEFAVALLVFGGMLAISVLGYLNASRQAEDFDNHRRKDRSRPPSEQVLS